MIMRVEIIALCDAATDSHGKLNILGSFDTICANELPAMHPQCAVVLRIRFNHDELGMHDVKIQVVNSQNQFVFPPLEAEVKVNANDPGQSVATNMILNIQRLKVEAYGEYTIKLVIDENELATLPLFIKTVSKEVWV